MVFHLAFLPNTLGDLLISVWGLFHSIYGLLVFYWRVYQNITNCWVFRLFLVFLLQKQNAATCISQGVSLCSFVRVVIGRISSAESELLRFVNFDRESFCKVAQGKVKRAGGVQIATLLSPALGKPWRASLRRWLFFLFFFFLLALKGWRAGRGGHAVYTPH